jgi:hypothetical protein
MIMGGLPKWRIRAEDHIGPTITRGREIRTPLAGSSSGQGHPPKEFAISYPMQRRIWVDNWPESPRKQCRYCGQVTWSVNLLGYCGERCTEKGEGPAWRERLNDAQIASTYQSPAQKIFGFIILALVLWFVFGVAVPWFRQRSDEYDQKVRELNAPDVPPTLGGGTGGGGTGGGGTSRPKQSTEKRYRLPHPRGS